MEHFAGLDVSVKETSVCIVDDTGKIVREVKVGSEPDALLAELRNPVHRFKRIGFEAGPLAGCPGDDPLGFGDDPCLSAGARHCGAALSLQNLCLKPSETPVLLGLPSLQLRMILAEIEFFSSSLYVKPVATCGVL
jgi:hypothetical protein